MNKYPDNVIKFPVSQRPAKNKTTTPVSTNSPSSVPFLKEMIEVIDKIEAGNKQVNSNTGNPANTPQDGKPFLLPEPERYSNEFLTLKPLKELDFDIFENKDTVEDSEVLDRYLAALATQIGPVATRKLARVIEEYVAEVADIAFAEGLTEGAIPME